MFYFHLSSQDGLNKAGGFAVKENFSFLLMQLLGIYHEDK